MPKRVELERPVKGHGGVEIRAITLRDPRYLDYMDIGLPSIWVSVESGGFEQEATNSTREWIERLCDCDPNFLGQLSLADTLALRDAVMSFFREARKAPGQSMPSPDTSCSDSNGMSEPSRI
jgi:hypothetical protein